MCTHLELHVRPCRHTKLGDLVEPEKFLIVRNLVLMGIQFVRVDVSTIYVPREAIGVDSSATMKHFFPGDI